MHGLPTLFKEGCMIIDIHTHLFPEEVRKNVKVFAAGMKGSGESTRM
jgi:hypothetical protein